MSPNTSANTCTGQESNCVDDQSITSQDEALMEMLGMKSPFLGGCVEDEEDQDQDQDDGVETYNKNTTGGTGTFTSTSTCSRTNRNNRNNRNNSQGNLEHLPVALRVQNYYKLPLPRNVSRHFHSPEECFAIHIANLLSPEECQKLIALGSTSFDYIRHAVHTTPDGTHLRVQLQNPNRHKLSVFHHEKWVQLLWDRLTPFLLVDDVLASFLTRESVPMPTGLNPRLRVLKYDATDDDEFAPHFDATTRIGGQISLLTVLLYLNSGGGVDFQGGETCYLDASVGKIGKESIKVTPQVGSVVVFEHDLFHAGQPLEWGTKYVLRTDLLFEISEEEWEQRPTKAAESKTIRLDHDASLSLHSAKNSLPLSVQQLILSMAKVERWTDLDQSILTGALDTLGMLDLSIESFCAPGRFALQMMLQDTLRSIADGDKLHLAKKLVDQAFSC